MILIAHLLLAGVWLGCVLTEVFFERALLGQGHVPEQILARLHKRVDMAVELPAFVLLTCLGMLLLRDATLDVLLAVKIACATVAVLANIWCIRLVFQRAAAAEAADWARFRRLDHQQHKVGAVVLLGILLALAIGLARHGV